MERVKSRRTKISRKAKGIGYYVARCFSISITTLDGFIVLDVHTDSIVGSDGEIYTCKNSVVTITPQTE